MKKIPISVLNYYKEKYKTILHLDYDMLVYIIQDGYEDEYFRIIAKNSDETILKSFENYKQITLDNKTKVNFVDGIFVIKIN